MFTVDGKSLVAFLLFGLCSFLAGLQKTRIFATIPRVVKLWKTTTHEEPRKGNRNSFGQAVLNITRLGDSMDETEENKKPKLLISAGNLRSGPLPSFFY